MRVWFLICASVCAFVGMAAEAVGPAKLRLETLPDGRTLVHAGSLTAEYERGVPVRYSVLRRKDVQLTVADSGYKASVVFGRWDPQKAPKQSVGQVKIDMADPTTARSVFVVDGWKVTFYLQMFPDHLAVRRWMSFEPCGSEKREFSLAASFSAGKLPCAPGKGRYLIPGMFPPKIKTRAEWRDGTTGEGGWNDISPIAADNGEGLYCLAVLDCIRDYSDRGRVLIHERSDGLGFSYRFEGEGIAHPGKPQVQGDAWLMFGTGTVHDAVSNLRTWHRLAGHKLPKGRPEAVKRLSIYSTHPKGNAAEYGQAETRGFRGLSADLPYLKALGVNTVWLRPVEDKGIYNPVDYYRLQEGIGTEADHIDFVRNAHAAGFNVWRDAVPHGGSVDCDRSKKHPEWICRNKDGSFADKYWAYDFNWPTWVSAFGDYISWATRKYELDGWRMDVPTGSRFSNWNPDIPYARASYSQLQGGRSQMQSIRAAARSVNPSAVTLAEANETWVASYADVIYDQHLAHWLFKRFCDMEPSAAVRGLSQWLELQRRVYMPGTVWMRYPESHDTYLSANIWGRAATDAMMALCAWIGGVPMVCNGSEDMCFENYREILRIRDRLPELSEDVSYSAVEAPEGVFACLRSCDAGSSVVLVNFNPDRVSGFAKWKGGRIDVDLAPYAYRVERVAGPSLSEALGRRPPLFVPKNVPGPDELSVELRAMDGKPVRPGWRVSRRETARGVCFTVTDFAGLDPGTVRLVARLPKAEGWFAHAAEGDFQGPYHLRYPEMDAGKAWEKQYGFVRWSSARHPFGLTAKYASVGGYRRNVAWRFTGFGEGSRVEILDRAGIDNGVVVSVAGDTASAFTMTMETPSVETALAKVGPGTGDERLKYIAGGWLWDDGAVRVRLRRNGAVVGVWRRKESTWEKETDGMMVRYRRNTGPSYIGWDGVDGAVWSQALDPYATQYLTRTDDGVVRLTFSGDRLRNRSVYAAMPDGKVAYRAHYAFGRSPGSFSGELAVGTDSVFGRDAGGLCVRGVFADEAAARTFAGKVHAYGPVKPVVKVAGTQVDWIWHQAGTGTFAPRAGNWCRIRFGEEDPSVTGFTVRLKVNLDAVDAYEPLYEYGAVKLYLRMAGENRELERYDRLFGNYLNFKRPDGRCPVIEADLGMRGGRVGIPIGALAKQDGNHDVVMNLSPVHWTIKVDERMDDEVPVPKYPVRWPLGAVPRVVSPRVKTAYEPGPSEGRGILLESEVAAKTVTRPIQYWTPDDHNAWVGDVALGVWRNRMHVFYLLDRRHHFSGAATGRHAFAHLSSGDLIRWEEHPFAVPITEWYECLGTGTPFVWQGKLRLAYGLHTSRVADDRDTFYCHWNKLPAEKRKGGVFKWSDAPWIPHGGTYATTDDGIRFVKSKTWIGGEQNPTVWNRNDGKLCLASERRLFCSETGDPGWWKEYARPENFGGDCPMPFEWNGHTYIMRGFHWFDHSENGVDFEDWTATGDDIYDGLSVPSVAEWKNGRRILCGWLAHVDNSASWGGWLVFRELVQYPDGKLGIKWADEISAPGFCETFRVDDPAKPFVLRFGNGKGAELEFRVDAAEGRAQFADVKPGEVAPRQLTLRERHEKYKPANARDKMAECTIASGRPFAIEKIRGVDAPYTVHLRTYHDMKSNATIFDMEIAGGRTMITRRAGRWKKIP